ncbi:MAG: 2-oxoacid:acceptor oxidoreductase family protein [Promethearchaeota archaeon]
MATRSKNLNVEFEASHEKCDYDLLCVGIGGTGVIRASMIIGWAALKDGFRVRTAETHGMSQRGGSVSSYLRFGRDLEGPFMIEGTVDVMLSFEISEALRNLNYANRNTIIITSRRAVIPPSVLTHYSLKVDVNKCVGCGNCLAYCIPNQVYYETGLGIRELIMNKGPTRQVRNGYSMVLESCTGCSRCVIDRICPFGAIETYNEWQYPPVEEIEKDLRSAVSHAIIVDADEIAVKAGNILAANVVIIGILAGLEILPLKIATIKKVMESFVPRKALEVNQKAFEMGIKIGKEYKLN